MPKADGGKQLVGSLEQRQQVGMVGNAQREQTSCDRELRGGWRKEDLPAWTRSGDLLDAEDSPKD